MSALGTRERAAIMRLQRSILMPAAALALLFGVLTGAVGVASAQDDALTIPGGTVILGSPGDVIELGRLPVDNSRAGPLCTWTATATNQRSVHPGSDVLITSNGVTLVLADVEAAPDKVTSNTGSVYLADEVVISIRLGPDGRFSGRMIVTISYSSCEEEPTTTTADVTDTTPTSLDTTTIDTATTEVTASDTTAGTEPAGPVVSVTTETTTTTEATTTETTSTEATTTEATTTETTSTETSSTETTVAAATATTTAPTAPDALPVTGSELTMPLFGAGIALSIAGFGLVSAARRREV